MKILILHQNDFKRYDYHIAIDHKIHNITYAGYIEHISTIPEDLDCEKIILEPQKELLNQLRDLMYNRDPFDKIITRSETMILPASILRDEFSISGMLPNVAINFRDKVRMKKTLEDSGIRVPRFYPVKEKEETVQWNGKTVLKPIDGLGSQGIMLFNSYSQAKSFVARQKKLDRMKYIDFFEYEEYIEGEIWHIDGFLYNKKIITIQSSFYIGTCLSYQINGTPLGSVQKNNSDLEAWVLKCLLLLGAKTMTFHMEAIMTKDGPVFLEVAARCGGGYIADVFKLKHGIFLHHLDMATDVEGTLAKRFNCKKESVNMFGFFLFPGHIYNESFCNIFMDSFIIEKDKFIEYSILPPNIKTSKKATYKPNLLPFAGIVSGINSQMNAEIINSLIKNVSIKPINS